MAYKKNFSNSDFWILTGMRKFLCAGFDFGSPVHVYVVPGVSATFLLDGKSAVRSFKRQSRFVQIRSISFLTG